ncbi:MAG: Wzz/FepE/Etk N-terminal domain-containing protein [Patescibacteria group bacterium]
MNKNNQYTEQYIELSTYLKVIKKRFKIIILVLIIFILGGYIYSLSTPTTFQSSINIYTTDALDMTNYLQTNHAVNSAYTIFKTLNPKRYSSFSLSYFRRNVRSVQIGQSIVSLTITNTNKNVAIDFTKAYAEMISSPKFNNIINNILKKDYSSCIKVRNATIATNLKYNLKENVPVCIETKLVISKPSNIVTVSTIPSKSKDVILFLIAGIFIALLLATLLEYMPNDKSN